jgi:transglutaminase-like putative cysteine protease
MSISGSRQELHSEFKYRQPAFRFLHRIGVQRAVLCASLAMSLLPGTAALAKSDSVPDWVHSAAAQSLPTYPEETKAVVLLDDRTYTVAGDGRAVEHVRRVVKILRPQGRDEAVVHVAFDKDTKILSMNVWSIGTDGHEYAMKDKEMSDVGFEDEDIAFADDRYRVAHAPAADPGAIIAYEYEQRVRPFITQKTWFAQEDIPFVSESFTLQLPPGYTYAAAWSHHTAVPAADLEGQGWRWEMKNVAGIDMEHTPLSPAPYALAARMTVYYAAPGVNVSSEGTWSGVGEWYQQLYKDRIAPTPELTAKAQELTAGKTDLFDKAQAIGQFVQKDVRYVAIEVGIGGYQPHAAADVFHNRYGDCKDKATLMAAMLSTVGIHAVPVMVDSERGVIDPDAPSLVGNHIISAIELPAGYSSPRMHTVVTAKSGQRYLIFDPTSEKTPFGQLEHELQGSYGLLLHGTQSEAIQLPVLDPALNTVHRSASFVIAADGTLSGTVTEKRFGDLSDYRRQDTSGGDAKEQREYLDHVLQHDFTSFTASNVQAANSDSLNKEFTLTYTISADGYARSMGPLLMVRPRVLGDISLPTDRKRRVVPIDLDETMQITDDYSVQLPPGYVVDDLPDPVSLDLDFASYHSAVEAKGSTLHYTRTYIVRQVTLPSERYADVQKLSNTIAADQESRAVLKKQ